MNWIYLVLYVICSVSGSTLLKFGSMPGVKTLFTVPFINMNMSFYTFIGFVTYGLSFIFYTILLSKFDLSFISPLTVGLVYVILMITAFVFFKEAVTFYKILGSSLILVGILLIITHK